MIGLIIRMIGGLLVVAFFLACQVALQALETMA